MKTFHLLDSDLCGLLAAHSDYRYFILYIDDFSQTTCVYFRRSKNTEELVLDFQEFQAIIDKQYPEYMIGRFRCGNGQGKYNNMFFPRILRVKCIFLEPSHPYT